MVRIKISDLYSSRDEQLFNEITDREMKTVEGGVVFRQPTNRVETTDQSSTTNNTTSVRSTLRQVNRLLDNLRFELDKLYGGYE